MEVLIEVVLKYVPQLAVATGVVIVRYVEKKYMLSKFKRRIDSIINANKKM